MLENVAQRTLRYVAAMEGYHRSPLGTVLMTQEMVTALDPIDHKASALQSCEQLTRGNLRQAVHARASLTGTNSLIVLRGSDSDFGNGQPFSR